MEEGEEEEEIAFLQKEVSGYHPSIQLPPVQRLPTEWFGDKDQRRMLLARLAADMIDLIVCDSQIGENEVAGQQVLESALSEECFTERNWSCCITSKQGTVLSNLLDQRENGSTDLRRDWISKNALLAAYPRECAPNVSELVQSVTLIMRAVNNVRSMKKFGHFIGGSKTLNNGHKSPYAEAECANIAAKCAAEDGTVLLIGEQGTGKDIFARAIHDQSDRKDRPFISVDCGALSEGLMDSELFGHIEGAFYRALSGVAQGGLRRLARARCFWTRSAISSWTRNKNCCACLKVAKSYRLAAINQRTWMLE